MIEEFWLAPDMEPRIVTETPSYLIAYKPPRMHTAPLQPGEENNLLAWIALRFPEVLRIKGRKDIEGGLIHRLDYETQGLVLCARTKDAMKILLAQQEKGEIGKEYEAVCCKKNNALLPGFPPLPAGFEMQKCIPGCVSECESTIIESAFRPYGKGRKAVRPLLTGNAKHKMGELYRTEILSCTEMGGKCFFKICIRKGFRHQIRCHLAWIGRPILNDSLYSSGDSGFLALRATGIVIGGQGANVEK